jgi:hypothetical protein
MDKHLIAALAFGLATGVAGAHETGKAASAAAYRCGGVGATEQAQFQSAARDHDLLLTFADTTGAYVADVDVRITSASGEEVLRTSCGGPLMLVDLPGAGRYHVEATFNGQQQRRTVHVGDRTSRVGFAWAVS